MKDLDTRLDLFERSLCDEHIASCLHPPSPLLSLSLSVFFKAVRNTPTRLFPTYRTLLLFSPSVTKPLKHVACGIREAARYPPVSNCWDTGFEICISVLSLPFCCIDWFG